MAEQTSAFAAVGDTLRALTLAGPYFIWRGPGLGTLALEIRNGAAGTWRRTGETLSAEGVVKDCAPYSGHIQYRLVCIGLTAGVSIPFEVFQ